MSMYATIELDKSGFQDLPKELDPQDEGLVYGQNLGQCDGWDELDAICTSSGAKAISSYIYSSEIEEEYFEEEMPEELANWSSISDGIKTCEKLVSALESRSSTSGLGRYTAEDVLWDLRACLSILTKAEKRNEKFRIDLG